MGYVTDECARTTSARAIFVKLSKDSDVYLSDPNRSCAHLTAPLLPQEKLPGYLPETETVLLGQSALDNLPSQLCRVVWLVFLCQLVVPVAVNGHHHVPGEHAHDACSHKKQLIDK